MLRSLSSDDTPDNTRRSVLTLGLLALLYPLLRFIGYSVPRKPVKIEITTQPAANGIVLHRDFIIFDRENEAWAISRRCTHLGCTINYHEQEGYLECPCHQSRFTPAGEVLRGPAKKQLTVFAVEKNETAPYYIVTT